MLTDNILKQAFPTMTKARREAVVVAIQPALARYEINTARRIAAFVGQCAHESGLFSTMTENLSYSAERLMVVFKKYFPSRGLAERYALNPVAIANRVYASRLGNGDEESGHGFKFRGKGPLMLTGRHNVTAFAKALGKTVDVASTYLETMEGGFMGAGWWWQANRMNAQADGWRTDNGIKVMSAKVNGADPAHGLAERIKYSNAVLKALEGRS